MTHKDFEGGLITQKLMRMTRILVNIIRFVKSTYLLYNQPIIMLHKISLVLLLLMIIMTGRICGASADGPVTASHTVTLKRNIFRPLWEVRSRDGQPVETDSPNNDNDRVKAKTESLLKAEEQARIETKKREIEATFKLTGFVLENDVQAVVQNIQSPNRTYIVKNGDSVEGLEVSGIDPVKNEVVLNCEGLTTVVLRLE